MADFETTTIEEDCRVWAWGLANIETPEDITFGNSISSFMKYVHDVPGIYYFHNLKFDGNFIIYWLLTNDYTWSYNSKRLKAGEFSTMISDMGVWYTITLQLKPGPTGISGTVVFRDSSRLIPLRLSEIPKAFGLEEQKLDLDYVEFREVGHELTEEEKMYLRNDVIIPAKAIKYMLDNNQTKLTCAANAMFDYKQRIGTKEFNRLFPALSYEVDRDIRQSYKGGWTFLNPFYKNKEIKEGSVYDINSMYPWAMKYCVLPYGKPVKYNGGYEPNALYPLYVQHCQAAFRLKPGKYPSIQLKHTFYADNEYLVTSYSDSANPGGVVDLWLTSVDLQLFKDNYYLDFYKDIDGYMFMGKVGLFDEYIDYWYEVKTKSKAEGNKGMETIAKRMLNSLYGKFGAKKVGKSKIPYYDANEDIVKYKTPRTEKDCKDYGIPLPPKVKEIVRECSFLETGEMVFTERECEVLQYEYGSEERQGGYIPVATFITSYCRDKIIRAAEKCGARFIYGDTDSLHIIGLEIPEGLDVDEFRLGAFKKESEFKRAKFIRQKTYMEILQKSGKEEMNLKAAGMPDKMKATVTEDMFVEGMIFDHSVNEQIAPKLSPKVVPGGVILVETTFQIKKAILSETYGVFYDGQFQYADCPYARRYL